MAKLTEMLVRSSIYSMCKYTVSWLLKVGLGSALSVTCNFIGNSLSQESYRAARALFTKTTEKFWKEAWGWRCESEDRMNQSMKRDGNVSEFALTSTHTLSSVIYCYWLLSENDSIPQLPSLSVFQLWSASIIESVGDLLFLSFPARKESRWTRVRSKQTTTRPGRVSGIEDTAYPEGAELTHRLLSPVQSSLTLPLL